FAVVAVQALVPAVHLFVFEAFTFIPVVVAQVQVAVFVGGGAPAPLEEGDGFRRVEIIAVVALVIFLIAFVIGGGPAVPLVGLHGHAPAHGFFDILQVGQIQAFLFPELQFPLVVGQDLHVQGQALHLLDQ